MYGISFFPRCLQCLSAQLSVCPGKAGRQPSFCLAMCSARDTITREERKMDTGGQLGKIFIRFIPRHRIFLLLL